MTNRLAESQSLYLRKHAENPIDWWFWCDEALEVARRENKPIFLSIGYSSCHWCTVMEGEAFSDSAIADYMNANFIPIKVDREERPDLDSIYMQTLQMITGQGGWPLNVFLSPDDLIPFYGGTYFPIDARYGRPGFLQILQAIHRFYNTETAKVRSLKEELLGYLQEGSILSTDTNVSLQSDELLQQGIEKNTGVLTPAIDNPCFPMIPHAELALRGARFNFESQYDGKQICIQRGLDLALGGIYDHIAGGFHRYTVDPTWTVPHFEKMLYDNGQIVEYLANLSSTGVKEPAFERAIAGTVNWLQREMTAPVGYFYAAQDADSFIPPTQEETQGWSEPEEGAFYVWEYNELEQLLTNEELTELKEQFTVTPKGNFEGKNVLQRRHPGKLSDTLEAALNKLFAVRYGAEPNNVETFPPARNNEEAKTINWQGRIPPVTDTKMIVAWNSLMISGLARAYSVFKHQQYWELATKAAEFILNNQWVSGRFHRLNYNGKAAVLAQSEDYALFIKALLDLHQASFSQTAEIANQSNNLSLNNHSFWLEQAIKVQEEFDEFLWSVELGGYYNTASDASGELIVRERSYMDNATPSANGIAIAVLIRLALLTEDLQYLDRAEKALYAFSSVMLRSKLACPSLFTALDWYRHHTLIRTTQEQITSLVSEYLPTGIVNLASDLPSDVVGLVCQGLSCKEPAYSNTQLWEQIIKIMQTST